MLADGERWLADMQERHASTRVTYARAEASACVPATIGRSTFNAEDAAGVVLNVQTRDFIIRACKLVLDDVQIEPKAGDRIHEGQTVYEVSAPAEGLPAWQWAEPTRLRYRIHTKLVSS